MPFLTLVLLLLIFLSSDGRRFLKIRGGILPFNPENDFYDQFELDYGCNDTLRNAGSLRGFIKTGKIKALPESDDFLKWLNNHLEAGPQPITGRIKPFYVIIHLYIIISI